MKFIKLKYHSLPSVLFSDICCHCRRNRDKKGSTNLSQR